MSLNHRLRYKTRQTNYVKRLAYLKSGKVRLVYRKTNTRLIAGFYHTPAVDKPDVCLISFDSRVPGLRTSKNDAARQLLVNKISTYLKTNPLSFILDVRNKRQAAKFMLMLDNELNKSS